MSEGDLVDCPECQRPSLKRLISAAAFRLKGSGWYETDFKKDNKRNLADSASKDSSSDGAAASKPASTDKNAATPSADSGTKKADTTPAAKTTSKESKNA